MTRSQTSKAWAGLAEIVHASLVACISGPENCLFFHFLYSSLLQLRWPSFQNHSQPSKSSLLLGQLCFFFFFFKTVSTCQRHCHPSQVLKPGTQAHACACTVVSDSATPRTVTYQAPLPMNFPGKNTGVVAIFYSTLILLFLLVSV